MAKGSNSSRLGRYNKSILLTELRRSGTASKAVMAQRSGLSPQAVTRIVDELEKQGLVRQCGRQRGGKGQPSVLYRINPSGAYAIGVKLGRRYMEMLVMDFGGRVLDRIHHVHAWPDPEQLLTRIEAGLSTLMQSLKVEQRRRLMGVGVAMPWFIGQLEDDFGMSPEAAEKWRTLDFSAELEKRTTLPLFFENDDSAAAIAELLFGCGTELSDFLYVYLGTFVGGGVVVDGNLQPGFHGNSGAFASMPVPPSAFSAADSPHRSPDILMNRASLFVLARHLAARGFEIGEVSDLDALDSSAEPHVEDWLRDCADALAHALTGAIAVLDPEAIVIDSQLDAHRVRRLTAMVEERLERGLPAELIKPMVLAGRLSSQANVIGGAILPFYSNFVLDRTVLLTGGVPRRVNL